MIIKGKIVTITYPFIYFIICFFYVILSSFDYYFCEKSLNLIFRDIGIKNDENHVKKENEVNVLENKKEDEKENKKENEKEKNDLIKEKFE